MAGLIFMLFRSRSQQMKQLGKIAAPGALFNISEPMVFGIPLVMNPWFFLPFILTPVLLVIVSYTAMATGLVGAAGGDCATVYHADFYQRLPGDGRAYFRDYSAGR